MTEKEIGELRRRLRPDRTAITAVRGCYVSESREILTTFRQSLGLCGEEDKETYLKLLKKTLSGTVDKNLIDIPFRTAQVADSDEHRLLMALRDSELGDEETLNTFYQKVISSLAIEGNYLILLAFERYDVPFKAKDGAALEDGNEVYSYVLCAVCPVKPTKAQLSYRAEEKDFHIRDAGWAAGMPELGFLFPAFDGRRTNIYDVLYYTKSTADNHPELIDALFRVDAPKPADEQKASFQSVLAGALEEECSLNVVQRIHDELAQRIEVHKETHSDDALIVSRDDVRAVLEDCGVSEQHLAAFNVQFDKEFGQDTLLSPRNLIAPKKFEVKMPDVVVHVAPDRRELVETRVLGGVPYLLIRADEGVEVNGVGIEIGEKK
mgnify:CR=1 FL=1